MRLYRENSIHNLFPSTPAQRRRFTTRYAHTRRLDASGLPCIYRALDLECGGRGEERAGDTAFAEPERHDRIRVHVSHCESTYLFNTALKKSGVAG
jgi:hypothetical protein